MHDSVSRPKSSINIDNTSLTQQRSAIKSRLFVVFLNICEKPLQECPLTKRVHSASYKEGLSFRARDEKARKLADNAGCIP